MQAGYYRSVHVKKTKFEFTKFFSWLFFSFKFGFFFWKKNQICKFVFFFRKKSKFEFGFFFFRKNPNLWEKKKTNSNLVFFFRKKIQIWRRKKTFSFFQIGFFKLVFFSYRRPYSKCVMVLFGLKRMYLLWVELKNSCWEHVSMEMGVWLLSSYFTRLWTSKKIWLCQSYLKLRVNNSVLGSWIS